MTIRLNKCLIVERETDWELIVISTLNPWLVILNDVVDIEHLLPDTLSSI